MYTFSSFAGDYLFSMDPIFDMKKKICFFDSNFYKYILPMLQIKSLYRKTLSATNKISTF